MNGGDVMTYSQAVAYVLEAHEAIGRIMDGLADAVRAIQPDTDVVCPQLELEFQTEQPHEPADRPHRRHLGYVSPTEVAVTLGSNACNLRMHMDLADWFGCDRFDWVHDPVIHTAIMVPNSDGHYRITCRDASPKASPRCTLSKAIASAYGTRLAGHIVPICKIEYKGVRKIEMDLSDYAEPAL